MNTPVVAPVVSIAPLAVGGRVVFDKGCAARGAHKGTHATITAIEELGADHSHAVRVQLKWHNRGDWGDSVVSFYARHVNRLVDPIVSMNDGDPTHKIKVCRA